MHRWAAAKVMVRSRRSCRQEFPAAVEAADRNAGIVGNDGTGFNMAGNRDPSLIQFDLSNRIGFVRFVGSHAEYNEIDASNV